MQRGFAPARALRDDVVSDLNLDSFQQRDAYNAPALKFVARDRWDARPTVTFPAAYRLRPLTGTHYTLLSEWRQGCKGVKTCPESSYHTLAPRPAGSRTRVILGNHDPNLWRWPMMLTFNSRWAMVVTHTHGNIQGRRSVGSKDEVETNGRQTDKPL